MRTALDPQGRVIWPTRRVDCVCPECNQSVIARIGDVKVHHWAHKSGDGDHRGLNSDATVPMTPWHRNWEEKWPRVEREVPIWRNDRVVRRADVCTDSTIIEFQHSGLKREDFAARTATLLETGRLVVWVFDARGWRLNLTGETVHITDPQTPSLLWLAQRTNHRIKAVLDTGSEMVVLTKAWPKGEGMMATFRLRSHDEFLATFKAREDDGQTSRERVLTVDGPACPSCFIPVASRGEWCEQCAYERDRCDVCRKKRCICAPCIGCRNNRRLDRDGLCYHCFQSWCWTCEKTTATLLDFDRVRKCDVCYANRGLGRRWQGV